MQSFCFINAGYPVSVSGMITLPVSSSVYQSMVANIQQIHTNGDGTLCITPMQVQNNNKNGVQSNVVNSNAMINCNNNGINSSSCGNIASNYNQFMTSSNNQNANGINQSNNSSNLLELCRALNQTTPCPNNATSFSGTATNHLITNRNRTKRLCDSNMNCNNNNNNNNMKYNQFTSTNIDQLTNQNRMQNSNVNLISENVATNVVAPSQPIKLECEVEIA